MKSARFQSPNSWADRSAFSLVEVTLAMGIAAVALVSILGMLPQAMKYGRDGADQTAIGAVLEDVHDRLKGSELKPGELAEGPFFYDQQGKFLSEAESQEDSRFFRVEVGMEKPVAESGIEFPEQMYVATLQLFWPVDESGLPFDARKPRTTVTYPVTALTGPRWQEIDPTYRPKVEY